MGGTRGDVMKIPPLTKVLLIEDDPDILEVVKMSLEAVGHMQVEAYASGKEGVAKAPSVQPDLILLDVRMPEMDGPATLKALRALPQTATTPVVFLTASIQHDQVEAFKALGALEVLPKPFDPMALPHTLRALWEKYHLSRGDF